MHLELTTCCERRCLDCYIPLEQRKDSSVIDLEIAMKAVQKGIDWGIRNYILVGGETFSEDTVPVIDTLLTEHRTLNFYSCTNGFFIASQTKNLDFLVLKNNLLVGLSIDGMQKTNDLLRGKGAYSAIMSASEYLKSRKCFYGAVTTIRPDNSDEVVSEEFVDLLISRGFLFSTYSISDNIDASLCRDAVQKLEALRKKPIYIYVNALGSIDDMSPLKRVRAVYVDKDGQILNDRKERVNITDLEGDLKSLTESLHWTKKFTSEWAFNEKVD
jgi:sulfatase maturation enzyme AslB (radical SAM superfamily)